jgi:RNA polymerase sigma factor (sigma-70 family)
MAKSRYGTPLRHLSALFNVGTIGGLRDAELMERFTAGSGEAAELAFAAIVERHGPMVLRVCQSVLHEPHDAQDAFQATFLVLARKAGAIRNRDSLASWLHGAAWRIADCTRVAEARRRRYELGAAKSVMTFDDDGDRDDLAMMLHEELGRMPEKYRVAIVLCHLEGLSHDQAAQHLRWPVGTVRSRLARGREQLRNRLIRRGLAISVGLWQWELSAEATTASFPAALVAATAEAAVRFASGTVATNGLISASVVSLVKGAMHAMFMTKLKFAVLACGLIATGAVVVAQQSGRAREAENPRPVRTQFTESHASRSGTLDDAAADEAAVARELRRLDLDVLADEVKRLREQVEVTLRDKLRAERRNPEAANAAQSAYEAARASYLAGIRELRSEQRRIDAAKDPRQAGHDRSGGLSPPRDDGVENRVIDTSSSRPSSSAIGSIDMDAVFKRYEKAQQAEERLKADRNSKQEQLDKLTTQTKASIAMLHKFVPGSTDFKIRESQIEALKRQYDSVREPAEREFTRREAENMAVLFKEIQDSTASVAKDKGLNYVIKVSPALQANSEFNKVLDVLKGSVVYADPRNDLTEEVIRDLNRRFQGLEAKTPR